MANRYHPNPLPRRGLPELVNQLEFELEAISRLFNASQVASSVTNVTQVSSGGSSSSSASVTDEQIDDRVALLIQDGTGLTWTYDDAANTFTGDVDLSPFTTDDLTEGSTNLYFTNERVDDRVDALIQDGTNLTWSYDDTLNTLTGNVTSAALTKTDDTNVTLLLGGSPTTALLAATSLTLGWAGTLADGRLSTTAVTPGTYGSATQVGQFTVGATGRITSATNVTISGVAPSAHNLLSASHGDTVVQTVSRGSLIYGNSTPKWDELVIGAANRLLRSDGTDASWAQAVLTTDVTGTLPPANGGTGATTLTGLLQGNGTSAFTTISNSSTVGQILRVTGASAYAWGALDLANTDAVTGTLPQANIVNANLAGTTNQISLSASGTDVLVGSTNITLSTPQDIHTSAAPQFAKLGIGGAATARLISILSSGASNSDLGIGATGTGSAAIYLDASDGDFAGADYALIYQDNTTLDLNLLTAGSANSKIVLTADSNSPANHLVVAPLGNIGISTATFGTSLAKGISWGSGTAASASVADTVQMWVADTNSVAGKAGLHLRSEDGVSHVFGNNVGLGTLTGFGTSAANVLSIASGTAPSTSPADVVQMWSVDTNAVAGKAGWHLRSEDGTSYVMGDNFGIGTLTGFGTSAAKVVSIASGTAPSTSPADVVQMWVADAATDATELYARSENSITHRLTGNSTYSTANFDKTSNTTLSNITGVTLNVEAGKTYTLLAHVRCSAGAGGIRLAVGGTATATTITASWITIDSASPPVVQHDIQLAMGSAGVAATLTSEYMVTMHGYLVVNAGGTITLMFAQNSSSVNVSKVLLGAYLQIFS